MQLKARIVNHDRYASFHGITEPGRATPLSLQYVNSFMRFSPVTTPAGTRPSSPILIFYLKLDSWSKLNYLETSLDFTYFNHQSRD